MCILFLIGSVSRFSYQKADLSMQSFKRFRTVITGGIILFILLGTAFLLNHPLQTLRLQPSVDKVTISASDGLTMVGDFYRVSDANTPLAAVLLLHGQGSNRSEWTPLIPPLLDAPLQAVCYKRRAIIQQIRQTFGE